MVIHTALVSDVPLLVFEVVDNEAIQEFHVEESTFTGQQSEQLDAILETVF